MRNRLKVESTVNNAQRVLELDVPFSELLWSFVGGEPKLNRWKTTSEIPAETAESKAMSKELKRRGFRFVGPDGLLLPHAVGGPRERPHGRVLSQSPAMKKTQRPSGRIPARQPR